MLENRKIEQLVKKIALKMIEEQSPGQRAAPEPTGEMKPERLERPAPDNIARAKADEGKRATAAGGTKLDSGDYPLAERHPELIKSYTGKRMEDITLDRVVGGEIISDDIRISAEVLEYQAQIAESVGKKQFASNLRRAAEMTRIPDDEVLKMYNLLRPGRATKKMLLDMAANLENKYGAFVTAKLVRDAAFAYEKRGILLKE